MSWVSLDDRIRVIARAVLTEKQLVAYKLSENGMSDRQIAIMCGVSRRAIRDRLDAADLRISSHPDYPKEAA